MSEQPISLRTLRRPVVIAAFEGWNDASEVATDVIEHLSDTYGGEVAFTIDGEDYYDFQMNRPMVTLAGGTERVLSWPETRISVARLDARDLVLIEGPEPNLRWRAYASAVVSVLRTVQPEVVVFLGAMLTDAPHSRPVPVSGTAHDADSAARLGLEVSTYEGPTGITGVLSEACRAAGFDVASLWASVPHYVANPPNPKATLALLTRVEDLLDQTLEVGDLPELAKAWERGVDELAGEDPDVADYIAGLEAQRDESELPEATGDAIAAEFQRYLRRRET